MSKEIVKRYSQAFKQQVVREYENGRSAKYLRDKYGIGSYSTVKTWVGKYGHSGFRSEIAIIQSVEDQLEFKAMKQRIQGLESALAQAVLDNRMLTTTLEVASNALEIDLKKNFGQKS